MDKIKLPKMVIRNNVSTYGIEREDESLVAIVFNQPHMKKIATLFALAPKMYEALQKIANIAPGVSSDTDDGCSYYESECGTCYEMIGIAQEALRKIDKENEVHE